MIKTGMIIGDRYEILEKIGAGGMSDVYKAHCHKLNRLVAIKVLKQEFSENAEFVRRFSTEAQAAAGLIHPNIVAVYDVGEENGMYYIVMELVEGITLKKYIEKKSRLSVNEAVSIAIQISMGIMAAHAKHIVHRDIKPQNIIISREGKVKVTDFGIAKAASSNTASSNVMGSVHYTSPEQARGGYVDEKSDIYSLGITLFEMLTGHVPFNGDTTVAIAIKHIQEEMPSPCAFIPEIPVSVEKIVLKCCQKSPMRRYQSMAEVIDDLKRSLMTPDEDFVEILTPDSEGKTQPATQEDLNRIRQATRDKMKLDDTIAASDGGKVLRRDGSVPRYEDEYPEEHYDEDEDFDPKKERLKTILIILVAVLMGSAIIAFTGHAIGLFGGNVTGEAESATTAETVEMIDVIGMQLSEAESQLTAIGLVTSINYVENSAYAENVVIGSDVEKGSQVEVNSTVTLTVVAPNIVEVPDVTGKTYEQAKATLENAGFNVNKTETTSSAVRAGYVISQSPAGGENAAKNSNVTLTVSAGSEDSKVRVPNLLGMSEQDAMASLVEAGLELGSVTQVTNSDYAADEVCEQSVSEGSYLDAGSTVDIKISNGPSAATYSYSGNISGPTAQEDPNFENGTTVNVTIVTADGTTLLDTKVSSFPISVNYFGIKSSTGTITFTYVDKTEPVSTTDPETGAVTTTEGTETPVSFSRSVEFTKE